ncbi:MAG TPA: CsbD family protein [Frankiaceae bacterium]|nr:CsbD family protein [Frankiaceae bacterium]
MSSEDKINNKVEEIVGKAKDRIGGATGDRDLQAEGQADQSKSNLKQAGEKVKDAFKS